MYLGKAKVMLNNHTDKPVTVDETISEEVDRCVYLDKTVARDGDLMPEIKRRIALGCVAFGKVDNIMRGRKAGMKIKREVLNEYVISVMTYGSETWALTTAQVNALAVAQRKMERIMLGVTLRDRKHNTWIRQQTGVTDITDTIKKSKHQLARHVARLQDNRWWAIMQSNGLVTPRMDKTTRETKSEMESRPCSPFGIRMAKSGPRQIPVAAIQGGVPP